MVITLPTADEKSTAICSAGGLDSIYPEPKKIEISCATQPEEVSFVAKKFKNVGSNDDAIAPLRPNQPSITPLSGFASQIASTKVTSVEQSEMILRKKPLISPIRAQSTNMKMIKISNQGIYGVPP